MTETDKRFHVAVFNDNTVKFVDYMTGTKLLTISFKEHKDAVDCRDALMYQCNLMNDLYEENKKLRTLNYVNKEAVRLNNIKIVKIGKEDVDCSNINWKLLYELYNGMIDFYYDEVLND